MLVSTDALTIGDSVRAQVLCNPYWWIGSPRRRKSVGLAPGSKEENKVALDAAAWVFNIVTSVGIIMVNKALMATHGFRFGKTS